MAMETFEKITEQASLYDHLEDMSVGELLTHINEEDRKVALAVERVIPQVERLVTLLIPRMRQGGRLFYIGAGTSGRLGVLDASEIPPMALRRIRHEYMQHAVGAVESMPKDERFSAFTTLAMSEKSYNYAVEVLEEARKKIIARAANDSEVERVYEMMLVAFPMSKKIGKEAENEK